MSNKSPLVLACELAALGYRVMPVSPITKAPIPKKWPEVSSADPNKVTSLFANYTNCMVGIATGARFCGHSLVN